MLRNKKRIVLYSVIVFLLIILMILLYKVYIHHKYFTIEVIEYEYDRDDYMYNSRSGGYVGNNYYELYGNHEIIHFASDNTQNAFSKEGEIVFNHIGQLFLRDEERIFEVTEESLEYLFQADSLHFAQRIGNKVFYVSYVYNESYSDSYYVLNVYDDETMEISHISNVVVNDYRRTIANRIDFLTEDEWLVFVDGETINRLGLYNLDTGEVNRIIEYGMFTEGSIENIRLLDGKIYFNILSYSDVPSYGVDDIQVTGGNIDYCYDIDSGRIYKGNLKIDVIRIKDENLKDRSQLTFVKYMEESEVNDLFEYIEGPTLNEPEGDLYEHDTLSEGLFSFDEIYGVDIYYSFNQSNVMKYGELYREPFLVPVPKGRFVTNVYYYSVERNTGRSSKILSRSYHTY